MGFLSEAHLSPWPCTYRPGTTICKAHLIAEHLDKWPSRPHSTWWLGRYGWNIFLEEKQLNRKEANISWSYFTIFRILHVHAICTPLHICMNTHLGAPSGRITLQKFGKFQTWDFLILRTRGLKYIWTFWLHTWTGLFNKKKKGIKRKKQVRDGCTK